MKKYYWIKRIFKDGFNFSDEIVQVLILVWIIIYLIYLVIISYPTMISDSKNHRCILSVKSIE